MALSLSSVAAVRDRIGSAHDIAFGTYFLPPGAMRDALAGAARRGAHVEVALQADPYRNDAGARANADAASSLRAAGANVALFDSARTPFHLKAAVCDGVAFLDDRNWTQRGPDTVVADDDPADVALVRDALHGRGGANGALATRKDEALQRELDLVRHAGRAALRVETEHVSASPLARALEARARRGLPTTLIVGGSGRSRRELHTLRALRDAGVAVRRAGTNEKLACAGRRAWVGSASATGANGRNARQLEWGVLTRDPVLVGAISAALRRDAAAASPRAAASAARA